MTNRKLYAVYNLDKMLELRKFAVHNSLSKAALIISSFFVTKGSEIFFCYKGLRNFLICFYILNEANVKVLGAVTMIEHCLGFPKIG